MSSTHTHWAPLCWACLWHKTCRIIWFQLKTDVSLEKGINELLPPWDPPTAFLKCEKTATKTVFFPVFLELCSICCSFTVSLFSSSNLNSFFLIFNLINQALGPFTEGWSFTSANYGPDEPVWQLWAVLAMHTCTHACKQRHKFISKRSLHLHTVAYPCAPI